MRGGAIGAGSEFRDIHVAFFSQGYELGFWLGFMGFECVKRGIAGGIKLQRGERMQ